MEVCRGTASSFMTASVRDCEHRFSLLGALHAAL